MTFEEADELVKFVTETIRRNNPEFANHPQWEEVIKPIVEYTIGSTLAVLDFLQKQPPTTKKDIES